MATYPSDVEGVLIADHHGQVLYINQMFEAITGQSAEHLSEGRISILGGLDLPPSAQQEIYQQLCQGIDFNYDLFMDNGLGWQYVQIHPIRNRQGQIYNFIRFQNRIFSKADAGFYEDRESHATTDATVPVLILIDPFSAEARALLGQHQDVIDSVAEEFANSFYATLQNDPKSAEVLNQLSLGDMDYLRQAQARHLRFIADPGIEKDQLIQRAIQAGRSHALVGTDGAMLLRAQTLYRQLLVHELENIVGHLGWKLLSVLNARLDLDVQTQVSAVVDLRVQYYEILEENRQIFGSPVDELRQFLEHLANLPGIMAALLMVPDADGQFYLVRGAGKLRPALIKMFQNENLRICVDASVPQGQGPAGRAWRSLTFQVVNNLATDESMSIWSEVELKMGMRSHLVLPIRDQHGNAAANLALYGAYPNQFGHREMQTIWGKRLQSRIEALWQQINIPIKPISIDQGESFRERLFSGGLKMLFQPVVDMSTGQLIKIETLARLEIEKGELISPGVFLPLLGSSELYRLFWLTLKGACEALTRLSKAFPALQVSVNLPPSSLLEQDLIMRLDEFFISTPELRRQIVLEVLETEEIHKSRQHDMLSKIKGLHFLLALDDLGAGYGSLIRLLQEPFDILKIDQNLVRRLTIDPIPTLTLLAMLIRLGRDLKREVVVEGLESPDLVEALLWLEAPLGQGFAFAKPMSLEQIESWAENFTMPSTHHEIRSWVGAFAWHWKRRHQGYPHIKKYEECPLTLFLKKQEKLRDDLHVIQHWHRSIHNSALSNRSREEYSELLLNWLANEIQLK